MWIEQYAYGNRWRRVSPVAKGLFALGGFVASFSAVTPGQAMLLALLLLLATVFGAGVPLRAYLRVALIPLSFLALGCLSLAYSLDMSADSLSLHWLPGGWLPLQQLAARACAALSALLFLTLSTPMVDLIVLLRRLRCPESLLDLMVLCYRMLFVFSETLHTTRTAQAARLGYATPRLALRSLGGLVASLSVQVWQRAHDLYVAAQARNNAGTFRFMVPVYQHARRDSGIAALAAVLLVVLVRL